MCLHGYCVLGVAVDSVLVTVVSTLAIVAR